MQQINRLFEIVYILLDKKKVTASDLAEHFEVSKRTILRDLDTLSMAGIPIYTSKGRGGGIAILDNFVLNKTAVTEEEQNQILIALQSLSGTQQFDAGETISRLGAFFQKTDTSWIEVDFSRWGYTKSDKEQFELMKNAVIRQNAIRFSYPDMNGVFHERTVYPLKLVFKSSAWYLQGYCLYKQDYRMFKIGRMQAPILTGESFDRREYAVPPVDAEGNAPMTELKLHFRAETGYRIFDEFDAKSITKQEDGSFIVCDSMCVDDWFFSLLLSFGSMVTVLGPESVRKRMPELFEEMKKNYL